jgi:hypothetical protein
MTHEYRHEVFETGLRGWILSNQSLEGFSAGYNKERLRLNSPPINEGDFKEERNPGGVSPRASMKKAKEILYGRRESLVVSLRRPQ